MTEKAILDAKRIRRIPDSFSWIDHRFIRDGHVKRCDTGELALYFLLVTVGDDQGMSYYSDRHIQELLHFKPEQLKRNRAGLIAHQLIAYRRPLYQVLSLHPKTPAAQAPEAAVKTTPESVQAYLAHWREQLKHD